MAVFTKPTRIHMACVNCRAGKIKVVISFYLACDNVYLLASAYPWKTASLVRAALRGGSNQLHPPSAPTPHIPPGWTQAPQGYGASHRGPPDPNQGLHPPLIASQLSSGHGVPAPVTLPNRYLAEVQYPAGGEYIPCTYGGPANQSPGLARAGHPLLGLLKSASAVLMFLGGSSGFGSPSYRSLSSRVAGLHLAGLLWRPIRWIYSLAGFGEGIKYNAYFDLSSSAMHARHVDFSPFGEPYHGGVWPAAYTPIAAPNRLEKSTMLWSLLNCIRYVSFNINEGPGSRPVDINRGSHDTQVWLRSSYGDLAWVTPGYVSMGVDKGCGRAINTPLAMMT
ncbi:hypothetical protein FB451DRAFT_1460771 [Mycena latifolia]|nr:hypothetical protein FB451DRAFT_1460771 [Mycena latifolia]